MKGRPVRLLIEDRQGGKCEESTLRILSVGGAAIVLSAALLSCQTAKPNTAGNSIQTEQTGLAPNGDKDHQTIDFALVFANKDAIKTWKVEMVTGAGPQKQWSGDAKNLPSTVTWDGRSESGSLAPEGTYTAKMTVDYGSGTPAATAESGSFILDVSPPTGSVTFNPQQFSPDAQGAVRAGDGADQGKLGGGQAGQLVDGNHGP